MNPIAPMEVRSPAEDSDKQGILEVMAKYLYVRRFPLVDQNANPLEGRNAKNTTPKIKATKASKQKKALEASRRA
jgi:hypothetical protein